MVIILSRIETRRNTPFCRLPPVPKDDEVSLDNVEKVTTTPQQNVITNQSTQTTISAGPLFRQEEIILEIQDHKLTIAIEEIDQNGQIHLIISGLPKETRIDGKVEGYSVGNDLFTIFGSVDGNYERPAIYLEFKNGEYIEIRGLSIRDGDTWRPKASLILTLPASSNITYERRLTEIETTHHLGHYRRCLLEARAVQAPLSVDEVKNMFDVYQNTQPNKVVAQGPNFLGIEINERSSGQLSPISKCFILVVKNTNFPLGTHIVVMGKDIQDARQFLSPLKDVIHDPTINFIEANLTPVDRDLILSLDQREAIERIKKGALEITTSEGKFYIALVKQTRKLTSSSALFIVFKDPELNKADGEESAVYRQWVESLPKEDSIELPTKEDAPPTNQAIETRPEPLLPIPDCHPVANDSIKRSPKPPRVNKNHRLQRSPNPFQNAFVKEIEPGNKFIVNTPSYLGNRPPFETLVESIEDDGIVVKIVGISNGVTINDPQGNRIQHHETGQAFGFTNRRVKVPFFNPARHEKIRDLNKQAIHLRTFPHQIWLTGIKDPNGNVSLAIIGEAQISQSPTQNPVVALVPKETIKQTEPSSLQTPHVEENKNPSGDSKTAMLHQVTSSPAGKNQSRVEMSILLNRPNDKSNLTEGRCLHLHPILTRNPIVLKLINFQDGNPVFEISNIPPVTKPVLDGVLLTTKRKGLINCQTFFALLKPNSSLLIPFRGHHFINIRYINSCLNVSSGPLHEAAICDSSGNRVSTITPTVAHDIVNPQQDFVRRKAINLSSLRNKIFEMSRKSDPISSAQKRPVVLEKPFTISYTNESGSYISFLVTPIQITEKGIKVSIELPFRITINSPDGSSVRHTGIPRNGKRVETIIPFYDPAKQRSDLDLKTQATTLNTRVPTFITVLRPTEEEYSFAFLGGDLKFSENQSLNT